MTFKVNVIPSIEEEFSLLQQRKHFCLKVLEELIPCPIIFGSSEFSATVILNNDCLNDHPCLFGLCILASNVK